MANNKTLACDEIANCIIRAKDQEIFKFCYKNVPWSEEPSFCDCSSWYGFVGDLCDERTPQVVYYIFGRLLALVCAACLLFWIACVFIRYIRHPASRKKTLLLAARRPLLVLLGVAAACIFLQVSSAITLAALLNPRRFTIIRYESINGIVEDVTADNGLVSVVCLWLSFNVLLLSSLLISTSWLEIAEQYIFHGKSYKRSLRLAKILINLFMASVAILQIALFASNLLNALLYLPPIVAAIEVGLFCYGRNAFIRTVQIVEAQKERMQDAIDLILKSSKANISCLVVIAIASLIYCILFVNYVDYVPVGNFNVVLFFKDVTDVAGFVMAGYNIHYAKTVLENLRSVASACKVHKLTSAKREEDISV